MTASADWVSACWLAQEEEVDAVLRSPVMCEARFELA